MGKKIGIDLGIRSSIVAFHDGMHPKVLLNREGKGQTPSVVGLKKRKGQKSDMPGEILVGETAYDYFPMAPENTILSIKRLMGKGVGDSEVERVKKEFLYKVVQPSEGTKDSIRVLMDDKEYSPIDISAIILKKMKEDAEYRLQDNVTHAVITVPAYFGQLQKDATYRAATKAGLKVIALLDEPTAAAIAFGLDSGNDSMPKTILVYDFGGGTFDISVLMWAGNVFAPLNLEGDMWLGGDNLDQELINYVVEHVREEYKIDPASNMRFMAELKKKARNAKEKLSSSQTVDIIIPGLLQDGDGDLIDVELEVTRNEFNRMIRPHVARTISLVEKAIENANLTKDQIDFVLMAGNSTNVPLVQEEMEKLFGSDKIMRNIHPKHCKALGAATLAGRFGEESMGRVRGYRYHSNVSIS